MLIEDLAFDDYSGTRFQILHYKDTDAHGNQTCYPRLDSSRLSTGDAKASFTKYGSQIKTPRIGIPTTPENASARKLLSPSNSQLKNSLNSSRNTPKYARKAFRFPSEELNTAGQTNLNSVGTGEKRSLKILRLDMTSSGSFEEAGAFKNFSMNFNKTVIPKLRPLA